MARCSADRGGHGFDWSGRRAGYAPRHLRRPARCRPDPVRARDLGPALSPRPILHRSRARTAKHQHRRPDPERHRPRRRTARQHLRRVPALHRAEPPAQFQLHDDGRARLVRRDHLQPILRHARRQQPGPTRRTPGGDRAAFLGHADRRRRGRDRRGARNATGPRRGARASRATPGAQDQSRSVPARRVPGRAV